MDLQRKRETAMALAGIFGERRQVITYVDRDIL